MANVDLTVLTKVAINKLTGTKPKGWDTDARELFESVARASHPDATAEQLEAAWRDGLTHMRENFKDEWDMYAKASKRPGDMTAIPWKSVELVKGQSDGDSFTLHFNVDGLPCVIECSDVQLLDADFILRKLVMYTRKDVACPFLGRKQVESWRRNVVIPWLKSDAFKHTERQTMGDMVDDLIREYCANTVAANEDGSSWLQLKRAVADKNVVYVPFSGLQEFIGKHAGDNPTKKVVKNALSRLGFNEVKKGKRALRFHSIPMQALYGENIDPSETGGGKIDTHSDGSESMPAIGGESIFDKLREEERDRPAAESGPRSATTETPGGEDDLPHDPFAALS